MKGKWTGNSYKNQRDAYKSKGKYSKNKKAKIERHLKNHPEDMVAQAALDNIRDCRHGVKRPQQPGKNTSVPVTIIDKKTKKPIVIATFTGTQGREFRQALKKSNAAHKSAQYENQKPAAKTKYSKTHINNPVITDEAAKMIKGVK